MKTAALRQKALGLSLALAASGCFTVEHRLPPHSYFGQLPRQAGETAREIDRHAMKNWYLSGLFAWSDFNMVDLARTDGKLRRIDTLELETRFSVLDTVIWIFPGAAYGYYLWAPRTLHLRGREIRGE